jgi:lysophospholipase L1-like esterase
MPTKVTIAQKTIRPFLMRITRFFLASLIVSRAAWGIDCTAPHWVAAWQSAPSGAAPIVFRSNNFPMGAHQSFREVFSPLGHGSMLRLKFSNRFSKVPLVINKVTLARQSVDAAIDPATLKQVFFNGKAGLTIQPGKETLSDPVSFNFVSMDRLTVSIAVGKVSWGFIPTEHNYAREYSYATLPSAGDHSADTHGNAYVFKTTRRHILVGMETLAPADYSAIVTLGDSITDGGVSTTEKPEINVRYPDFLKRRIDASGLPMFVANAGISGNKVATRPILPFFGHSALERYSPDVLQQAGVRDVILLIGINDIGQSPLLKIMKDKDKNLLQKTAYQFTYNKIISAYTALIEDFQKHGIKVMQGTLTPVGKSNDKGFSGKVGSALRRDVNLWIRNHSPADTIVDFDAAVRDPNNPEFMLADYDIGGGIHFNEKGNIRLAEAVDLSRFQGSACRR